MEPIPIRAFECCVSFMTCDVLDAAYFEQLAERAARHGVNTFTFFMIPDAYYPETSPHKDWEFEMGLDWPCQAFPQHRNPTCPNADEATEFLPRVFTACKAHGIRTYLRTINNKHRWLYPEHDAWRAQQLMPDGSVQPSMHCSWDRPAFMAYYYRLLEDLLRRYATGPNAVDGLILDQQKCFGPYVDEETRARYPEVMGRAFDLADQDGLVAYWSMRNAERVRGTVAFCKAINPALEVGLTLEAVKPEHVHSGSTGFKYPLVSHATTEADFIHLQVIDHTEAECAELWELFAKDGPVWVMLDPTAGDAGWAERYWGWEPRTPDSIANEMAMVRRVRAGLSRPDHLVGVTEFPLSRLPLAHPNVQACLEHIGRG
jgi:hypothetical protein